MLLKSQTRNLASLVKLVHAPAKAYANRSQARGQGRVREEETLRAPASCSQSLSSIGFGTSIFPGRQTVSCYANRGQEVKPMEVEVKLRLPDRQAYERVFAALSGAKLGSYAQENYFFDGDAAQLNATHTVLRLRFFNDTEKAAITIKGRQVLEKGVGVASEVEEDTKDPIEARKWLQQPDLMLAESPLVSKFGRELGIQHLGCMGGFRNQRDVFSWEGEKLELDETTYPWGTLYEIEVETVHPEELRSKLEGFLGSQGISFSYSKCSKFGNFKNKTLE